MATMSIREFQAQSIANLVQTFTQVHIYCEPLFNVIVAEGARGCAFEMEPQAVANTAQLPAAACLQSISCWRCLGDICKHLCKTICKHYDLLCFRCTGSILCFSRITQPWMLDGARLKTLRAACKTFQWQHALHSLDVIWEGGLRPGIVPCSEVLRSMARQKKWQQSLGLLTEILRKKIQPDTVCVNICLHACERQWEHCLQLFGYLDCHLKPSVVSYGALFASLGGAHKWIQVLALLREIPMHSPSDMQCMQVLFNTAFGAFRDSHRWELALDLCQSLDTVPINPVGWAAVIAACCKGSQWQIGLTLLHRSNDQGTRNTLQTYNWLLRGMRSDGHWRVGLVVLQDAVNQRLQLNHVTFSNLLQLWKRVGLWHQALLGLEHLKSLNLHEDAEIITSVLAAMERNHRLEESRHYVSLVRSSLCNQIRDNADLLSTELHEVTLLHEAWAGASLPGFPDVFGIRFVRRLGAPLAAVLHRDGCMNSKLLQNVYSFGLSISSFTSHEPAHDVPQGCGLL
eukprot:symbB.v1.2.037125.t1/scaffold5390.1/size27637/4